MQMANMTAPGNLRLCHTWRVSARLKPAAASNGKTRGVSSRFILSEFIIGQWPGRLERVQADCWVLMAARNEGRPLLRDHAAEPASHIGYMRTGARTRCLGVSGEHRF